MPLNAKETREKGEFCGAMMITAKSISSNLRVTREETKEANGGEGGGGCGYDRRDKFKGEHVNVAESQDVAMELK